MKYAHTIPNSRMVLQQLVYMFRSITCIPRAVAPPGKLGYYEKEQELKTKERNIHGRLQVFLRARIGWSSFRQTT